MNRFESINKYKEFYRGTPEFNSQIFEQFVKANNIVSCCMSFTTTDMYKSLNNQRGGGARRGSERPPYDDHSAAFKTGDGVVMYTYQPYFAVDSANGDQYKGYLDNAVKCYEEVNAWCQERNIKATFFGATHSWYNPNHTSLIVITSKDVKVQG